MQKVGVKEISSRLGKFCLIRVDDMVLLTPCDTRVKIITALQHRPMSADELSKSVGSAYSTVMDHMDVLEKAGLVTPFLNRETGKRRIYFKLADKPGKALLNTLQ